MTGAEEAINVAFSGDQRHRPRHRFKRRQEADIRDVLLIDAADEIRPDRRRRLKADGGEDEGRPSIGFRLGEHLFRIVEKIHASTPVARTGE